jgi:poly(3-hydroxybutyrate) depolymerase
MLLFVGINPVHGEVILGKGTFAGLPVEYRVIVPSGYDASRRYPMVLTFGGGEQTAEITDNMIERVWQLEAERRGYIVVAVVAPNGDLFYHKGAMSVIPDFLGRIFNDYSIDKARVHIAGPSNGGLSSYAIAELYPTYFKSVTGFPGYLPYRVDVDRIAPFKSLCVFMHVGQDDTDWVSIMRQQAELFKNSGVKIHFQIEAGQGHSIRTLDGKGAKRLFEQLEQAERGCNP